MTGFGEYEDGYAVGWEEGRHLGMTEGYNQAVYDYEPRIKMMWAELQTLNARVAVLEQKLANE